MKALLSRLAIMVLHTLYGRIILAVAAVVISTVAVNLLVVSVQVGDVMRQAQEEHAQNFLQGVLANVEAQHRGLLFHTQTALDFRKKEVRSVVEFAVSVVQDYQSRVLKGEMDLGQAQRQALEMLRTYRYDNGTGYVWVNDVTRPLPRVIMHPILPELDGVIVDEPRYYTAYGQNIHLFKAFVDVCLENGAGYVDYLWPKPNQTDLSSLRKKLSYVRLFPEWGWVVGSGVYIDDIEAEAQRKVAGIVEDLKTTLGALRIGTSGYLFIFDSQDNVLVHPQLAGQSMKGLLDPATGEPLGDLFRKAATGPDNLIAYLWNKPDDAGKYSYVKRAYVRFYEPLQWYIGASVYADEESEPTNRLQGNLLLLGGVILSIVLLLTVPLVHGLVRPMARLIHASRRIAQEGLGVVPIPVGGTEETRQLGEILAQMVDSIHTSQRDLRESEEKYRSMMDAMDDMVFIASTECAIEYMNPAMVRFLGRDGTGLDCREAMSAGENFCSDCADVVDVGVHHRLIRMDGDRHYHSTTCPVLHSDGSTSRMFIIRDVSEQVRVEERLRGVQHYIQSIINSMPSVIIGVDHQGRISLWNKEATQRFGLDPEEARGRSISEFSATLGRVEALFRQTLDTTAAVKENKIPLELDGERRYYDVTVYPLDTDGGVVVRIDDVSELVRLEEIMIQSEKMLSIGGLAAGMAHEINNPLAGIVQNVQVIRNRIGLDLPANIEAAKVCGTPLEAVRCYLETRHVLAMIDVIHEAGTRAAKIVENMLSFARKSGAQKRMENLASLMDRTIELAMNDYDLKKQYDFRQIEIVRDYAPHVPDVLCEGSKIQQVFINLLKNGAQAMAEVRDRPSRFIVRIGQEGEWVRVEVEDNGPGMSEGVRKRIFEPFFTTKPEGIGTGLGLSVSYFIIVEHHGGIMRVETVPGAMTTFILMLPVDSANEQQPAEKGNTLPPVRDQS